MQNEQVDRPPLDLEALHQEIDDVFTFGIPITPQQNSACQQIQSACKILAHDVLRLVPEGKEQVIAINNLLAVALWSRHGITRRSIIVAAGTPFEEAAPTPTIHLGENLTALEEIEATRRALHGENT